MLNMEYVYTFNVNCASNFFLVDKKLARTTQDQINLSESRAYIRVPVTLCMGCWTFDSLPVGCCMIGKLYNYTLKFAYFSLEWICHLFYGSEKVRVLVCNINTPLDWMMSYIQGLWLWLMACGVAVTQLHILRKYLLLGLVQKWEPMLDVENCG